MEEGTRLICFDLGGVIVDTARRWEIACAASGVAYGRELTETAAWNGFSQVIEAYEVDALNWQEYLDLGARALEGMHSPEELARIHEGWLLGEYAGMTEIVQVLNANGRSESCCLSNTNRRHWEILESRPEKFATFHALQRRWNSFELRLRKPNPEIYRRMEAASGVDGSRILFFDDRRENIEAARACGWKAELVDRDGEVAAQVRAALSAHGVSGF